MRALIQRVREAQVEVDGQVTGAIGGGLLVLLGIETGDTEADAEWLCGKIARLRIFDDAEGVMNRSVGDAGGGILLVSQFTLHASTRKGNRPSYSRAAAPEVAKPLCERCREMLATLLAKPVPSGVFGAMMRVSLVNDGPVTILIDSRLRE